jgi:hypothetical protein
MFEPQNASLSVQLTIPNELGQPCDAASKAFGLLKITGPGGLMTARLETLASGPAYLRP